MKADYAVLKQRGRVGWGVSTLMSEQVLRLLQQLLGHSKHTRCPRVTRLISIGRVHIRARVPSLGCESRVCVRGRAGARSLFSLSRILVLGVC